MKNKAKKGRPRLENPMVHTAVVLPEDLLARLKRDAAASGKGLSTEIRERLKLTYVLGGERIDPETDDLLAAIALLTRNLARDLGVKWHEHPYALAALRLASRSSFRVTSPVKVFVPIPDFLVTRMTRPRLLGEPTHG